MRELPILLCWLVDFLKDLIRDEKNWELMSIFLCGEEEEDEDEDEDEEDEERDLCILAMWEMYGRRLRLSKLLHYKEVLYIYIGTYVYV